ncbi:reverse transcriptase [Phytophthora megakarya]|uniref:Reverse transcriptase n=1 Tax=Phytophthora megakarya TaxID=4795 RepID=A0A225UBD4_9STRA|nr:reverse transcriptase [Phytophthora megakarya]
MVLGMPWLARHDPTIDWEKRTVVCFGHRGATESDDPVSAADTPNGASEYPSETVARAVVSSRSARSAQAVTTPGIVDSKRVSGQGSDTSRTFSAVRRRGDKACRLRELTRARYQIQERSPTWEVEVTTVCQLLELRHTAPPQGVEVTTKHRLQELMRQAPGCTKQGAIKPGVMTRARGYKNPPAVARRLECLPAESRNIRP